MLKCILFRKTLWKRILFRKTLLKSILFRNILLKCILRRGTTTTTTTTTTIITRRSIKLLRDYIDNNFYLLLCILPSVKLFILNFYKFIFYWFLYENIHHAVTLFLLFVNFFLLNTNFFVLLSIFKPFIKVSCHWLLMKKCTKAGRLKPQIWRLCIFRDVYYILAWELSIAQV